MVEADIKMPTSRRGSNNPRRCCANAMEGSREQPSHRLGFCRDGIRGKLMMQYIMNKPWYEDMMGKSKGKLGTSCALPTLTACRK